MCNNNYDISPSFTLRCFEAGDSGFTSLMKRPSFPPPLTTKPSAQTSFSVFIIISDWSFCMSWNKRQSNLEKLFIIRISNHLYSSLERTLGVSDLCLIHLGRGTLVKQCAETNPFAFFGTLGGWVIEVTFSLGKIVSMYVIYYIV